jgi:phosphate/sulfate permease|tara:strand:+ start:161 stop:346 length:186 start_codon:yes stop_codon:yes gene_type:complete
MSEEEVDATFMFRYLLVYTAALESFAHGANDTANATGPFRRVRRSSHWSPYDRVRVVNFIP